MKHQNKKYVKIEVLIHAFYGHDLAIQCVDLSGSWFVQIHG